MPLVLHTSDALLVQVLLNLGIVHPIHRDTAPLLDKLVIYIKVCGVVVVEENFLLITRSWYLNNLAICGQSLHYFLTLGKALIHIIIIHATLSSISKSVEWS